MPSPYWASSDRKQYAEAQMSSLHVRHPAGRRSRSAIPRREWPEVRWWAVQLGEWTFPRRSASCGPAAGSASSSSHYVPAPPSGTSASWRADGRSRAGRWSSAWRSRWTYHSGSATSCCSRPATRRSTPDPAGRPALAPVRTALTNILAGHLPYPAVVIDRHGDLVAANAAFDLITDGAAPDLLEPPTNLYRLALHPDGLAPRIANFDEWAQHILERLHAEALRNPDERLDNLHAELRRLRTGPSAASGSSRLRRSPEAPFGIRGPEPHNHRHHLRHRRGHHPCRTEARGIPPH